jgi:hypothetical protein
MKLCIESCFCFYNSNAFPFATAMLLARLQFKKPITYAYAYINMQQDAKLISYHFEVCVKKIVTEIWILILILY